MKLSEIFEAFRIYQFPREFLGIKPIATSKGGRALPYLYVDPRGYHNALDELVGPGNWHVQGTALGPAGIQVRVTVRGEDGEYSTCHCGDISPGENGVTSAWAQAMRKALEAMGLGRHLWTAPTDRWFPYDLERKRFEDPDQVLNQLFYDLYGGE